jgi:hypothetical protein
MAQDTHIPLSQDAALVLGLAGTAVPFSYSSEDEAERWLRAMRLHGQVGRCLQALGVGEAPLTTSPEPVEVLKGSPGRSPLGPNAVEQVARRASELAGINEVEAVGTVHVLFAVLEVYGSFFDRALYLRGTSREELIERLASVSERVKTAD